VVGLLPEDEGEEEDEDEDEIDEEVIPELERFLTGRASTPCPTIVDPRTTT